MYGKPILRYSLLILLFLCIAWNGFAQNFSYVYIQGDKQTPFYVKFEGEMLPRYGKNYYIISELAPGPINIEVLFQQNVFPPEKFVIKVPENGYRGFLLTRKNDQFTLYDIHQSFYLKPGNTIDDDNAPAFEPTTSYVPIQPKIELPSSSAPVVKPKITKAATTKGKTKAAVKTPKTIIAKPQGKNTVEPPPGDDEPKFLDNIALNNNKTDDGMVSTGKVVKNKVAIVNSDCPKAMDNASFQNFQKKVANKGGTDRLKLLLDKMDECFTTNQVRSMAKTLSDDAEKFTYFKKVYARVTDQSTFPTLEKLIVSEDWKKYFRELVQQP